MRDSPALVTLVGQLKESYINLYEKHFKGKEKYARLLVAWHEELLHYTVTGSEAGDGIWENLVDGSESQGEAGDRSAIITAIAKGVYKVLTEKATLSATTVCNSPKSLSQMMMLQ